MTESREPDRTGDFPVVGLCASAGGLDSFQAFFEALPTDTGMAFIVVQHLATNQESMLHNLLERYTQIPVQRIADDPFIEPNQIYVLPEGRDLTVWNGQLQLAGLERAPGWPQMIDRFLHTLADDMGERAAAVIFSGAGSDGTAGVRRIKNAGGLVIVQDPETARQRGMPTSVIEAGLADLVLAPAAIPEALLDHFVTVQPPAPTMDEPSLSLSDGELDRVIRRLRRQTGRDFTDYKSSTLLRQIARRMGMVQINSVEDYLDRLNSNPAEAEELSQSLLINVSSFFRDPDTFETLKTEALLPALRDADVDRPWRAWVPGCAGGQEPISIAILIYECLRELNKLELDVRLFATDVNRMLVDQGRRGRYPRSIAREIREDRLRDHFVQVEDDYQVRNHISRMIIWSQHNLVEDPPFSKLSLLSCRNVLIYFQRRLQDRMLALFGFALQPGGILFLGSSETLPSRSDTFTPINSVCRIYQRTTTSTNHWLRIEQPLFIHRTASTEAQMPDEPRDEQPGASRQDQELDIVKDTLIAHYNSTCVIVDAQYRVRYTYGEIDRYLRVVPGREGQHNILDMAREGLDVELTIALHQAFDSEHDIVRKGVWVRTNGDERVINLIVKRIDHEMLHGEHRLIIFERVVAPVERRQTDYGGTGGDEGATVRRLQAELEETQRTLQQVTQALQAKSEELSASTEEIRSANEEVQTTNEELRTSKEELESVNEELNTLNTQLIDQNAKLTEANNTLHNFLQSSEIGMVFLDQELAVREYTAAVTELLDLRPGDMDRPLSEIANRLAYKDLIADGEAVLDTLNNVEKEVRSEDGRWYMVRMRPYRTVNNVIDGLVLTFNEITGQKEAQATAEKQTLYMTQLYDTIGDSLIELDGELRVVGANRMFYETFEVDEAETIGRRLYDLGNGQWDIADLRTLLTDIIPTETVVRDYQVTHDFPDIGVRTMRLNARQVAELDRILLVITEVLPGGAQSGRT